MSAISRSSTKRTATTTMEETQEWKLCAQWLVRCGVLAPNHVSVTPLGTTSDLARALRDGTVICNLARRLNPDSLHPRDVVQKPGNSKHFSEKNIRIFLHACRENFGLKDTELFQPSMLFDMTDFGKVVKTLSILSKTSYARTSGIQGFPRVEYYDDPEDLYNGLDELSLETGEDAAERPPVEANNYVDESSDAKYEQIYETIVEVPAKVDEDKDYNILEPVSKRDYCIRELLQTEEKYLETLENVKKHFLHPSASVMDDKDRKKIFMNIERLAHIHTGFFCEIQTACKSTQHRTKQICEVFQKWRLKLTDYGEYCAGLTVAQQYVDALCRTNEAFSHCVQDGQKKAYDGKFRLPDLLSVPMQRILKYPLILKELLKHTDKEHADIEELQRTLKMMEDLSVYINEVKRDKEMIQRIEDIQTSIPDLHMPEGLSLRDYGRLLHDGELRVKSHEETRPRSRHVFLFDKVLLMCKSRGDTYSYKGGVVLHQYKLEPNEDKRTSKLERWTHRWSLEKIAGSVGNEGSNEHSKSYTFFARTQELKNAWVAQFLKAYENSQPRGSRENKYCFVMHTFAEPTLCGVCNRLLSGFFYQGYHCSKTDVSVHRDCIPLAVLKPHPSGVTKKPSRASGSGSSGRMSHRNAKTFVAIQDYNGVSPAPPLGQTTLAFRAREEILVLNQDDLVWWQGKNTTSRAEGFFPSHLVRDPLYSGPAVVPDSPRQVLGTPPEPPANGTQHSSGSSTPGDPEQQPWYGGRISREEAEQKLARLPDGTFLIRESRNVGWALSLSYRSEVQHIKIQKRDDDYRFFIADTAFFVTLNDMVEHYQSQSLVQSFPGLDTTLTIPFQLHGSVPIWGQRDAVYCKALFDFTGQGDSELNIRRNEVLMILDETRNDGWIKGMNQNSQRGYFPASHVKKTNYS